MGAGGRGRKWWDSLEWQEFPLGAPSFVISAMYEFSDSLGSLECLTVFTFFFKKKREKTQLVNSFQIPVFFQIPQIFFFFFGLTTK